MNLLSKILLVVFCFSYFIGALALGVQAYFADHLILEDLDTVNNLATVCQDVGSLCSDVKVVNFDDLESKKKDQVIEMITSSSTDGYSYISTLDLDKFSNFLGQ